MLDEVGKAKILTLLYVALTLSSKVCNIAVMLPPFTTFQKIPDNVCKGEKLMSQ